MIYGDSGGARGWLLGEENRGRDATRVRALKARGIGATAIAKELGIGRANVYRVLEANGGLCP